MTITVKESKEVWKSGDGKIKLFDITLDNRTVLQTYSEKIAGGGTFEIESYEKNGKSFVRQPPKANAEYSKPKSFQADPVKMKQEWTLEVARNQSIQRQVAYKGVIDLMVSGKIELDDLDSWFDLSMDKLANPWVMVAVEGDSLPTDEEVESVELPPVEQLDAPEDVPFQ